MKPKKGKKSPAIAEVLPYDLDTMEELRKACELLNLPFEEVVPFLMAGPLLGLSVGVVDLREHKSTKA